MGSAEVHVPAGAISARRDRTRQRGRFFPDALRRRLLALADVAAVGASAGVVHLVEPHEPVWVMLAFLPGWLVCAKLCGLYDQDHRTLRHLTVDEFPRILLWTLLGSSLLTMFSLASDLPTLMPGSRLRLWVVLTVWTLLFRALARVAWRAITPPERVVVVGSGALASDLFRKFTLFPDVHVEVVAQRDLLTTEVIEDSHTGWLSGADRIVVASHELSEDVIVRLLPFCRRHQIKLSVVPQTRALFGTAVELGHIADLPLIEYHTWDPSRTSMLAKRALDVTVAAVGLVVLSPVLLGIALLLRVTDGHGVLFVQKRGARGGRPFSMIKFRTMTVDAEERLAEVADLDALEEPAFKSVHDPRVTRIGRWLRTWSLDELPQLWNVLRGDMSLVGPRPEQLEVIALYKPEHLFRLLVKPGMTGPMQIHGRGALAFEERLSVEREYVEHYSLVRDLRILAMTIAAVLRRRGAY